MSSWGVAVNPALWEGTRFPLFTRVNALQGRELLCVHHQHTHQLCTTTCCPQGEEGTAGSDTMEQKRSWKTRRNCLLVVQIIIWSIQWNAYKKIPSYVFVQATYLFFRLQGIQRQLFFQTTVFLILLFLLSPVNNRKWRSQLLKTIKWLCCESIILNSFGAHCTSQECCRRHSWFLKTQMSWS